MGEDGPKGPGIEEQNRLLGEGRPTEGRAHLCRLVEMKAPLYFMLKCIDSQAACNLIQSAER